VVAYSFQRMFVAPIRRVINPKRHTIRGDRKRHARPGETLQLYCRQRCADGFLIGTSCCDEVLPIVIHFGSHSKIWVGNLAPIIGRTNLNTFAVSDGFGSWDELTWFWQHYHKPIFSRSTATAIFSGWIVFWSEFKDAAPEANHVEHVTNAAAGV